MQTDHNQRSDAVLIYGEQMLAQLLDRIWNVLLILVTLAGTASALRFISTGWLNIYTVHVSIVVFYWACFLLRKKLSHATRVGILVAIFYVVGITALFTLGLIGAGVWWLVLCSLLAKIFYSYRAGLIHAGISLVLIFIAGYAHTSGLITVPFDANEHVTSVATWLTLFVGCVFISMFIFSAIATYQRALYSLLRDFVRSEKQLEENRHELNTLRELIPICAECKNVRDDKGYWESVEDYVEKNASVSFSHCLCPSCGQKHYGEAWNRAMKTLDTPTAPVN